MPQPTHQSDALSRRKFLARTSCVAAGSVVAASTLQPAAAAESDSNAPVQQATGTRVGEVTDHSAIVWTRLTAMSERNNEGVVLKGRGEETSLPVDELEGACSGAPGRIRLRIGMREDLSDAKVTDWFDVSEAGDFIHQFQLDDLQSNSNYHYASETTGPGGSPVHGAFRGKFTTAPKADVLGDFTFTVMTCQGYPDRGHPDGHPIYPAMLALDPKFACLTGDLVYYDNDAPRALNQRLARYHWERMFSLSRLREFTRNVATYWLKDDHDTLNNDSWPGRTMGEFTWDQGLAIFRQQAPMDDGPPYRTFRWGRDLQIWLTDGRDFRSPNRMPDGPEKTIWGAEQKEWFKRTVKESTATWKILVTPTPLVGPDRGGKNDNHSNKGFQTEGNEIRTWLQENVPDNFFSFCGDRHWQFHSVHPESGVHEFSAGAASDQHAGGTPGYDETIHKFHRVKGGFLSITLSPTTTGSAIRICHRDVNGEVVYEHKRVRAPGA
jgi:alkaline phosphatase D